MNVVSDCLLTEALLIGHRSCIGSVYSTYGLRERTNCGRGCSFSFFSCRNYYRDKEALRQMKQKKTCGKNQHVRIDNIYRKANLICCRTDDAVEINLRYYTCKTAHCRRRKQQIIFGASAPADCAVSVLTAVLRRHNRRLSWVCLNNSVLFLKQGHDHEVTAFEH